MNKSSFSAVIVILGLFTVLSPTSFANVGRNAPKGMAFDSAGNLLVANPATGRIFKFTPHGSRSTFASGLTHPFGIAFDNTGNLFVAEMQPDQKGGVILKFMPTASAPPSRRSWFALFFWRSTPQAIFLPWM